MKSKTLPTVVALLTFWANSTATVAHQGIISVHGWAAVKAIQSGEKLGVRLKSGKNLEGRMHGVPNAVLTLHKGNKTFDLDRDSVARVYGPVKRSAGRAIAKSTAIGAGIGFGIGAGIGIAGGSYEDLERGELMALLGGIGTGYLATIRPDGSPRVHPVSAFMAGDHLLVYI